MSIDVTALRADVETALTDAESVGLIIEELPVPAEVKNFVTKAEDVLKQIQAFLNA